MLDLAVVSDDRSVTCHEVHDVVFGSQYPEHALRVRSLSCSKCTLLAGKSVGCDSNAGLSSASQDASRVGAPRTNMLGRKPDWIGARLRNSCASGAALCGILRF